jgi:hypothetical protein
MSTGIHRTFGWALVALLAVGGARVVDLDAQVVPRRPAVGTGIMHIRSISPRWGPTGTAVHIRAHDLPANTTVFVALGALNMGYEVDHVEKTNERGELTSTLTIPDRHRTHWDHFHHVVILREENSEALAISDPFHITNGEGFVQRRGVVEIIQPGCAALRSWDGLMYALTGEQATVFAASPGFEVVVEGAMAEGTCGLQNAIDVARTSLPRGMR